MTMTNRSGLRAAVTPFASGALYLDRQLTHLDDATSGRPRSPAAIRSRSAWCRRAACWCRS
ncbi:hypothetical protein [Rhodanobacter lindaniclasticus]